MFARIDRANTIPETALVLGLALTVLYGVVQMALIGFTQVSADGAAFVGAHSTVAKYGGPNSSNYAYTTTAAQSVFPHLKATFAPSNPANGVYETDIKTRLPSVLSGIFGPTMTSARTIEPSSSSATGSLGPCATGAINLTGGISGGAGNVAVGLLQGTVGTATSIFNIQQDVKGNNAVMLTTGSSTVLSSQVTAFQTIATNLQVVSTAVQSISSLLNTARLGGTLGFLVDPITTALNNTVGKALTDALNGVPTAQMTSDLAAITSTVNGITNPLLSTLLSSLSSLLPSLTNALTGIDTSMQTLLTNDKLAPASC